MKGKRRGGVGGDSCSCGKTLRKREGDFWPALVSPGGAGGQVGKRGGSFLSSNGLAYIGCEIAASGGRVDGTSTAVCLHAARQVASTVSVPPEQVGLRLPSFGGVQCA